jgi:hypothetical protein
MLETYEIHFAFASILYGEWERSLKSCILVSEEEEGLMWSFLFSIFCCCQDDLEGICGSQGYGSGEGNMVRESISIEVSLSFVEV